MRRFDSKNNDDGAAFEKTRSTPTADNRCFNSGRLTRESLSPFASIADPSLVSRRPIRTPAKKGKRNAATQGKHPYTIPNSRKTSSARSPNFRFFSKNFLFFIFLVFFDQFLVVFRRFPPPFSRIAAARPHFLHSLLFTHIPFQLPRAVSQFGSILPLLLQSAAATPKIAPHRRLALVPVPVAPIFAIPPISLFFPNRQKNQKIQN